MNSKTALLALFAMLWVCQVAGYGTYRYEIPNGERIPHPCKPNFYWKGVGHRNQQGGGARNQFGLDFARNGHKWNPDLCLKDSDGDGLTNGQELGDPHCTWSKGEVPANTDGLSHPGVCTPFGSPNCSGMNDWVDCTSEEFNCTALDSPDTQNLTLRFPRTPVPAQETTYKCMLFDVPQDQDYHVVAVKPYIDNDNVMHHILLYGCGEFDETGEHPSGPYDCNMGAGNGCSDILGVWTLGNPGLCFHDRMGMLIGKNGFKKVALEFHWNNPARESNWTDASGMTLFFTNILRPYNGGMMTIGQNFLEIPPGKPKTIATATCSPACTSAALNSSIHITAALNHMHYLGSAQSVELRRNGEMVRYITNEPEYSYDNPIFNQFEDEIIIHPNDELITTCQYTSTYSKKWVYYGDATSAEMCFTLIFFYPTEAMPNKYCISWKSIETCAARPVMVDGCNAYAFVGGYDPDGMQHYLKVKDNCHLSGSCHDDCRAAVTEAKAHPCLKGGDIADFVMSILHGSKEGLEYLRLLNMCPTYNVVTCPTPSAGAQLTFSYVRLLLTLMMFQ